MSSTDTVPLSQYQELERKYRSLNRDYADCLKQLEKANAKLVKDRKVIKEWNRYIDSHPKYAEAAKRNDAPKPLSSLPSTSETDGARQRRNAKDTAALALNDSVPCTQSRQIRTNDTFKLQLPKESSFDLPREVSSGSSITARFEQRNELDTSFPGHAIFEHNPSSQTTQPGSDPPEPEPVKIKQESFDDDEPVVVSTRMLRKRPAETMMPPATSRGTVSDPYRIKREETQQTQSLFQVPAYGPVPLTQASDLDFLVREINTPRKRQRLIEFDHYSPNSRLPEMHRSVDENTPPSVPFQGGTSTSGPQPSEDSLQRSSGEPLQTLSTNTPLPPRVSAVNAKKSKLNDEQHLEGRILDIGEDDTDVRSVKPTSAKKGNRLDNLLQGNETPEPKSAISSRHLPSTVRKKPQGPSPATASVSGTMSPSFSTRSRASARNAMRPPPDPRPEEEPLRSRPLSRLSLEDFCINPAWAGTDYAFNASVRDRATRACLPGCTQPCCAALQRFASPSTVSNDTDPLTDEERTLLQSWLGRQSPPPMTLPQQRALVALARASRFASAHGRHRTIFTRAKTPEDFWRTDMPSTQELEERRESARLDKRAEVEGRWMEALRGDGGGRWRFRDEV